MQTTDQWHTRTLAERACEALKKNGFDAVFAETGKDALALISGFLKSGMSVGVGGSVTLKDIGIDALLEQSGVTILDHSRKGYSGEEKMEVMRKQLTCDLFLSGSNAITLDGEIFNIDGNGNRVAALTFGPRKTVVVIGVNKIVRNLDDAHARAETIASPKNNKRLDIPNPCTVSGICMDCQGEKRICRIYSVLKRRPSRSDFTVIIVGERLGF